MNESKSFARLEARVDPAAKALWQQAAEIQGVTLTDFMVATLQESAMKIIKKHQSMQLNKEESQAFVEAILNPTEPNEALKLAAIEHKEIFGY
ncbi:MAG: DUF1778 domain-containing protein [Pleurocapsa sp. MO_226.B13]|nr:DUF1778 domain-containing protein [Pleurocapsa sp. MO_226.B13]